MGLDDELDTGHISQDVTYTFVQLTGLIGDFTFPKT